MKTFYLTYAEPSSGVYSSQVIDVIDYLNKHLSGNIQLFAFISLHDFTNQKAILKKNCPSAIVLPMLPKATYWKINTIILWIYCLIKQPQAIIARNVIAANMALKVRGISSVKKVVFDGRGAIAAEWSEYDVSVVDSWKNAIKKLEGNAVNKSNFRIAVTTKLVSYWKKNYNYQGNDHVVIPCTLNSNFKALTPTDDEVEASRLKMNFSKDDMILAYSGSTAGWQSFTGLAPFMTHFLKENSKNKVIFLAPEEKNITQLSNDFPGQIIRKWVKHTEVTEILKSSDYGILIREQSVTNEVASPTKFAEYLSAGLPVIISENLGDYSELVQQQNCGYVMTGDKWPLLVSNNQEQRKRMVDLVTKHYTKQAHHTSYQKLIKELHT
jgi:hypothetical protein